MQQDQHDFFDVAIIGYGPVSEIMALALARQGRSVAAIGALAARIAFFLSGQVN